MKQILNLTQYVVKEINSFEKPFSTILAGLAIASVTFIVLGVFAFLYRVIEGFFVIQWY